jgi:hypothetical protein
MGVIEKHLKDNPGNNNLNPKNKFGLDCLDTVGTKMVNALDDLHLVNILSDLYSRISNPNQKKRVTSSYLEILPDLDKQEQKTYYPKLIDFIRTAPADFLVKMTGGLIGIDQKIYNFDDLLNEVTQRSIHLSGDNNLRISLFKLADNADARRHIESYVVELWGKDNNGYDALTDSKEYLRAEEFRNLVKKIIEKSDELPKNLVEDAFRSLADHNQKYTKQFCKYLTEEILNDWLQKPILEYRKAGILLWKSIREKDPYLQEKFYDRLIEHSQTYINDASVTNPENKLFIETLVDDFSYLSREQKNRTIRLCLRLTESGKSQNEKIFGYQTLAKTHADEKAQEIVPVELLNDLENDEIDIKERETIINTLLNFTINNKDLAERLFAYIEKLPSESISDEIRTKINNGIDSHQ